MYKRIKHVSDLPDWFDLTKYADAELLNTAGWYEQFFVRKGLNQLLSSNRQFDREYLPELLASVRAMPIVDMTEGETLFASFCYGTMYELKHKQANCVRGVHFATVRELHKMLDSIEKSKKEYFKNFFLKGSWFPADSKHDKHFSHLRVDWIDAPVNAVTVSDSRNCALIVNMGLPDNVLIEQFKRILKERSSVNVDAETVFPTYRKTDFNKWIRSGLLPLLDLKMWEQYEKVSIPVRVMADAIFPIGEGGEEVIRKTTEDYAKKLLSDDNLEIMAAQAANEIME